MTSERHVEPVTVRFTGMSVEDGFNVPLTVSIDELYELLATGLVEIRAKKIRSCVIEGLHNYYNRRNEDKDGTQQASHG